MSEHATLHLALGLGCYMKLFFREVGAAPGHPGENFSPRRPRVAPPQSRSSPRDLSQPPLETSIFFGSLSFPSTSELESNPGRPCKIQKSPSIPVPPIWDPCVPLDRMGPRVEFHAADSPVSFPEGGNAFHGPMALWLSMGSLFVILQTKADKIF